MESCIETLRSCSEKHGFAVLAYCFMPDHLHLLVEGGAGSDVPQFMKDFKQRTGYACRRVSEEALWQKSYYDQILRRRRGCARGGQVHCRQPGAGGTGGGSRRSPVQRFVCMGESYYGSLKASATLALLKTELRKLYGTAAS
ncbi:MAG: transposase [Chloroflexota bacterium]|nr:transposase [Chloroflexota bacterium]